MSEQQEHKPDSHVDDLYQESDHWHVNTGEEKIHPKRMAGRYRTLKWLTGSVWLIFFLGPYLRWDGRQAVMFDIPARQFHIFSVTVMPQDFWMLSLLLLFFAIMLAVVTSIAGRVFCGFFCFQTVWTDVYMWIEERLEGTPQQRRKLDQAPWDGRKLRIKGSKYGLWLLIAMLTGVSFSAWFTDAYALWPALLTGQAHIAAYVVLALFTAGTFLLAGFMREQVCFWLCPYARIQAPMVDTETVLPAYDTKRGEPRGKLRKGQSSEGHGDCVDCNLCVAVCPTGVDIRNGQQEGCITCALCIDACDSVMDKVGKPRGLVRYASLDELEGRPTLPLYKRPRPMVYLSIMAIALAGIIYGLATIGSLEITAIHERTPMYVQLSDGSIQNRYDLRLINKSNAAIDVVISADGLPGLELRGADGTFSLPPNRATNLSVFARVPVDLLEASLLPITFRVEAVDDQTLMAEHTTIFASP